MDINQARTYLAIVANGSFLEAAQQLHLTQSTVSARIQRLEEDVRVEVVRTPDDHRRVLRRRLRGEPVPDDPLDPAPVRRRDPRSEARSARRDRAATGSGRSRTASTIEARWRSREASRRATSRATRDETISARNFARMVASGSAAHNDHSRGTVLMFKEVAHGRAQGYELKDVVKLKQVAKDFGVPLTVGEGEEAKPRSKEEIAQELADKLILEFGLQDVPRCYRAGRIDGAIVLGTIENPKVVTAMKSAHVVYAQQSIDQHIRPRDQSIERLKSTIVLGPDQRQAIVLDPLKVGIVCRVPLPHIAGNPRPHLPQVMGRYQTVTAIVARPDQTKGFQVFFAFIKQSHNDFALS